MLTQYIQNINTFNSIYDITKDLSNKEKGDLFEELTKYIFIHHPYYKNITHSIWLYNEIPNNITEKLNISSKDKGIDLVMYFKDDLYY